jgi:hypothetical protein
MRTERSDRGGWSIQVPAFWEVVRLKPAKAGQKPPEEVVFADPLGAALVVQWSPVPEKLGPLPGETVVKGGRVQIGKYTYETLIVTGVERKARLAQFRFETIHPNRSYILIFECEKDQMDKYKGLVERLLEGFEIRDAQPSAPRGINTAV